jgi:tetratricopeptide (TPR) repeat protein
VRRLLFWPWAALTGHYLFHHHAVAIFCAAGFLAAAALLRSLWRRYFPEVSMAAVAILFGVCAGVLGLFYGTCSRYEAEFLPTLVFLAVVGILAVERVLVSRPRWRVTARAVWVLLLVFSLGFNVLEGFEHCLLGNHLDVAGRFADAIPQYQAALRINRSYVEAHSSYGNVFLKDRRNEEAIAQYSVAVQIKPDFVEARQNLERTLARLPGTK